MYTITSQTNSKTSRKGKKGVKNISNNQINCNNTFFDKLDKTISIKDLKEKGKHLVKLNDTKQPYYIYKHINNLLKEGTYFLNVHGEEYYNSVKYKMYMLLSKHNLLDDETKSNMKQIEDERLNLICNKEQAGLDNVSKDVKNHIHTKHIQEGVDNKDIKHTIQCLAYSSAEGSIYTAGRITTKSKRVLSKSLSNTTALLNVCFCLLETDLFIDKTGDTIENIKHLATYLVNMLSVIASQSIIKDISHITEYRINQKVRTASKEVEVKLDDDMKVDDMKEDDMKEDDMKEDDIKEDVFNEDDDINEDDDMKEDVVNQKKTTKKKTTKKKTTQKNTTEERKKAQSNILKNVITKTIQQYNTCIGRLLNNISISSKNYERAIECNVKTLQVELKDMINKIDTAYNNLTITGDVKIVLQNNNLSKIYITRQQFFKLRNNKEFSKYNDLFTLNNEFINKLSFIYNIQVPKESEKAYKDKLNIYDDVIREDLIKRHFSTNSLGGVNSKYTNELMKLSQEDIEEITKE